MQQYRTTQARRKRRGPNQISDRYWLAFRSLYGGNRSAKFSGTAPCHQIDDLNAEKMQQALS